MNESDDNRNRDAGDDDVADGAKFAGAVAAVPAQSPALPNVELEILRLERLSAAELAAEYIALHGKPPRSRHRLWLFRRVAFAHQEQRFGGLAGAARARLRELMAAIELPGEPAAAGQASIAPQKAPAGTGRDPDAHATTLPHDFRDRRALRPGTVLIKRWRDRELRLTALDDGRVDVDGATFNSLSAAARAITGTRWNGRAFFGLAERRGKK